MIFMEVNFLIFYTRCHCGVPELQTCIQRLLWHGHQVMYNHLASWMVYGILQDQHGEFFIRRQEDGDSSLVQLIHVSEKLARLSTDDASSTDWQDTLPEYIPMRVAESVLFAGKAVRVLRNPSPAFQSGYAMYHQIPKPFLKIQGLAGRFPFQEPLINTGLRGGELLPHCEADKIEAMLLDLKESSEFHKRSFECAVDSIQAIAASHLWQVLNIEILVHVFCWNIENQDSYSNTSELEHIAEVLQEFNKKSNFLYTILRSSRLAGSQRAPFLRRFLLRLNFNSFFEGTCKRCAKCCRTPPDSW